MRIIVLFWILYIPNSIAETVKLEYGDFTVWLNCKERGASKFSYHLSKDKGKKERFNTFYFDEDVDDNCQQKSKGTYAGAAERFDRGYLVPANHLDHSKSSLK